MFYDLKILPRLSISNKHSGELHLLIFSSTDVYSGKKSVIFAFFSAIIQYHTQILMQIVDGEGEFRNKRYVSSRRKILILFIF